jgi:hypothetical protein
MRALNGIPERTRSRRTPQIRDPRRLRGLVAQSCHVEGLSEKAATPGCREARRNAFPRNPPGNSPSRTAGNHQLCRTLQQGLRHLTYAVRALCLSRTTTATEKSCTVVRKLWRTEVLCGNGWKKWKETHPHVATASRPSCEKWSFRLHHGALDERLRYCACKLPAAE